MEKSYWKAAESPYLGRKRTMESGRIIVTREGARRGKRRVGPRSVGARPAGLQVAREAGGEWCRLRAARKMAVAGAWSGWPARWRRRASLHSLAEPLSCLTGCCHCCWHEGSLLLLRLLPHTALVTPLTRRSSSVVLSLVSFDFPSRKLFLVPFFV